MLWLLTISSYAEECQDKLPLICGTVYDYCTSFRHFAFLKENCQYSCHQCKNDCKDFVACRSLKQIGACDKRTRYDHDIVMRWCPRTCGSCKDKSRTPEKTFSSNAGIAKVLKELKNLLKNAKEGWESKMSGMEKKLEDALKTKNSDDKGKDECPEGLIFSLLFISSYGEDCKDTLPLSCGNIYDYCTSFRNFAYLRENCQYTCQQCKDDCKDYIGCRAVKQIGACDENTPYDRDLAMRWCPRTCGSCKDSPRAPKKTASTNAEVAKVLKELDDLVKKAKGGWESKMPGMEKKLDDAVKGKKSDDKGNNDNGKNDQKKDDTKKDDKGNNDQKKDDTGKDDQECPDSADSTGKVKVDLAGFDKLAKEKGDWKQERTFCAKGIQFKVIPKYENCAEPDGCFSIDVTASYPKSKNWKATVDMEYIVVNSDTKKNILRKLAEEFAPSVTVKGGNKLEKFKLLTDEKLGFMQPDKSLTFSVEANVKDFKKT
ncbi:unnamed protein product [Bursaphelenchus xylophilus]|uniref:(pine wood nematode) hypothetical protein n=1 Tax=Bursaphelenchus xylophilus TaxID=6326 RepID=A0A1I7SL44_BURXY|nr:unnamed protein product [Bursaphelenchus xylophilus]CAG9129363.1 unnamed protein product [Bursaphelenchus xylophilus]